MNLPVIFCRCRNRASGLFVTTKPDGTARKRIFCAACAFNQPHGTRVDLIRSFTTDITPPQPKPVVRSDEYTKRVVESTPMRPWTPNYASGTNLPDPNPHWIRSLRGE